MTLDDFAFVQKRKIVRSVTEAESHYLLPIDKRLTKRHDRALLLLHGFASSPGVFRDMLPHFTGYDWIVCPVLPGHCESIHAFSKTTAQDWQRVADDHCRMLVESFKEVTVVGMSLGGLLALQLSQRYALHHLYLLAPALELKYSTFLALMAAHCLRVMGLRSLRNCGGDFHTARNAELSYRRLPLAVIIEILSLIRRSPLIQPTCPTDVFLGRYDKVVDSQAVAELFARQKNVTIHWLNHSAHILPLDGDVELLVQAINSNKSHLATHGDPR